MVRDHEAAGSSPATPTSYVENPVYIENTGFFSTPYVVGTILDEKRIIVMEIGKCAITENEIIQALEKETTLSLATCSGNRVSIRPISHINDGLDVYFQTGVDSLKIQQIRENCNVALCVGTYQIEGVAHELGHPLDIGNTSFANAYKLKHPGSFECYSSYSDEVVVHVTIHRATQWRYTDGKPYVAEWESETAQ